MVQTTNLFSLNWCEYWQEYRFNLRLIKEYFYSTSNIWNNSLGILNGKFFTEQADARQYQSLTRYMTKPTPQVEFGSWLQ
jgi:hypothetical protein